MRVLLTFSVEVDDEALARYIDENESPKDWPAADILIIEAISAWEYDKLITGRTIAIGGTEEVSIA